jgi:predicted nucleotidyltransferase
MQRELVQSHRLLKVLKEFYSTHLLSVTLFGSVARGDQKPSCDIDILIIIKESREKPHERREKLLELLIEKGLRRCAPIVLTKKEFESSLHPLYLDIAMDAKVIFGKEYMERRLQQIKEVIKERGLYRLKVKGGFSWRWRKGMEPKSFPWSLDWQDGCKRGGRI